MKTEKFIISAILIFALTNYAYGMGGHHRRGGGGTTTDSSGGSVVTYQAFKESGGSSEGDGFAFQGAFSETGTSFEGVMVTFDDSGAAPVPEPATMLLLGSGLLGLWGLKKKFRK